MKVTVEFDNGATVTYRGSEAESIAIDLCLNESDYKPGEAVEFIHQHPPFLSEEADDPKEDTDGQN